MNDPTTEAGWALASERWHVATCPVIHVRPEVCTCPSVIRQAVWDIAIEARQQERERLAAAVRAKHIEPRSGYDKEWKNGWNSALAAVLAAIEGDK